MKLAERYERVLELFREHMPAPRTELRYDSPYQLLVAVILSAQCTDKRVNMVTPPLFAAYPTPQALAEATEEDIYEYIRSVSYPNAKSRSLSGMARMLVADFGGEVPADIDALMRLPGVGRKTANVILSVIFGEPRMAVDTHVFRVAARLGLTPRCKTPLETERCLMRHIPAADVPRAHHWLILHGRYVCKARRPLCDECFLADVCLHYSKSLKHED